jgi:hypothetical protein
MRLYYMTSFETATKYILPERRMRLGEFDKLNDPFELLCAHMGDPEHRLVVNYLREGFTKRYGIICMSAHWKSPLMWAHYAENHTGVCLGFDVLDDKIRKVDYTPDRIMLNINVNKPLRGVNEDTLIQLAMTKYSQWEYEEEWRLFGRLEVPDPNNGRYYVDFSPMLSLREIIVGTRCDAPVGSFRKYLKGLDQSVTVIKARPAFESFTMVRQQRVTPITVAPR